MIALTRQVPGTIINVMERYKEVARGIEEDVRRRLNVNGPSVYEVKVAEDDEISCLKLVVWSPKHPGGMAIRVVKEVSKVVDEYAKEYEEVWARMGTALTSITIGNEACEKWAPCIEIYIDID